MQWHIKWSYTIIKWDLFQGCKNSSIYANQSMWYTILTNKNKNHMIISIGAAKASYKIQHWFMTKTLQKVVIEETYLNIIKAIITNHTKHYSQWWKTESICFKIRNKIRTSILATIIQHSFGSPSHRNQRRKRNERNLEQKRSKNVIVCGLHDTVHRKS